MVGAWAVGVAGAVGGVGDALAGSAGAVGAAGAAAFAVVGNGSGSRPGAAGTQMSAVEPAPSGALTVTTDLGAALRRGFHRLGGAVFAGGASSWGVSAGSIQVAPAIFNWRGTSSVFQ